MNLPPLVYVLLSIFPVTWAAQSGLDLFEGGDAALDRIRQATVTIINQPTGRVSTFGSYKRPGLSTGSGFLISNDGTLITAWHVVNGATNVRIRFQDRREVRATVLANDTDLDVSVLRIDGGHTWSNFLEWGPPSNIKVGTRVVAVGNPGGESSTTFTTGIVSFLGRSGLGLHRVEHFLQTDAAINGGNSGGPLLTLDGRVAGINDAKNMRLEGVGYAIPSVLAKASVARMLAGSPPIHAWLGVFVRETGVELQEDMDIPSVTTEGLLVVATALDSPARSAGLRFKDLILSAGGQPVRSYGDLSGALVCRNPGDPLELQCQRGDLTTNLSVRLASSPGQPRFAIDDFTRLFLRNEWTYRSNLTGEGEGMETNRHLWQVTQTYVPAKFRDKMALTNGSYVISMLPGSPLATGESLQDPEQVQDLMNRCFIEDDRFVAFLLRLPMQGVSEEALRIVRQNLLSGVTTTQNLQAIFNALQWRQFVLPAHRGGF